MSQPLQFTLNGRKIEEHDSSPSLTVLDYLREHQGLHGTKEGCAEGDCGACTVVVLDRGAPGGPAFRALNSCLMLLGELHGAELLTVEGLAEGETLHPVQQALAEHGGSQCGYCTPGVVMSLYEAAQREKLGERELADQISGNLCRCTGYGPIRRAARQVAGTQPADRHTALAERADAGAPPFVRYRAAGQLFVRPASLDELWPLLAEHPRHRLVGGASDLTLDAAAALRAQPCLVSLRGIAELRGVRCDDNAMRIGATTPLADLEAVAVERLPMLAEMLRYFGSRQIKNLGTVGGNLCTASPVGDLAPCFLALGATLRLASADGGRSLSIDDFFTGYRRTALRPGEILLEVELPLPAADSLSTAFKVSKRRELDIAAVAAAFYLECGADSSIAVARVAFGGMAATPARAPSVVAALLGAELTPAAFEAAAAAVADDFEPISDLRGSAWFRSTLARNLVLELGAAATPAKRPRPTRPRGSSAAERALPENPGLRPPVPHESGRLHVQGAARYVDELPEARNARVALVVAGDAAHGRIVRRDRARAERAPGIDAVLFAEEIPGDPMIGPVAHDEPLLAAREVDHAGQAVALIVGESLAACRAAAPLLEIEIEPLPAILGIQAAIAADSFFGDPHVIQRGAVDAALERAEVRISGELATPAQDHFYLETQAALALPEEGGSWHIHTSSQHPSEVQHMVARALGVGRHRIVCEVPRMGGGFGGKESQPAHYAALAAIAAARVGRPVKLRLSRPDDMRMTGPRHPCWSRYSAGFDRDGTIRAFEVQIYADGGYSLDLSLAILSRALFHLDNAYYIPELRFEGKICKTHSPSSTAFRGFGGPQGMAVIEDAINRFAESRGLDPDAVRARNFYGDAPRDRAPYHQRVPEPRLTRIYTELRAEADLERRAADLERFNRESPESKRAIAFQPVKFGISFTNKILNQAGALVHFYADGTAQLNHGGTEMGQGLHTKMLAVCASELGLSLDRVRVMPTSTAKVPNTSATAASSGSDLNGQAIADACAKLRARLSPVAAGLLGVPADQELRFADDRVATAAGDHSVELSAVAQQAWLERVSLSATGFYRTPGISYDPATGRGCPFFYFAYGGALVEVELEGHTGRHRILRVDILHDVGRSLVPNIDRGQIEGGFLQGVGWLTCEERLESDQGRVLTLGPSTYKIPAAGDAPAELRIRLLDRADQPSVIGRSKAVGEPPFMLALGVITALRQAVLAFSDAPRGPVELRLPATPESLLRAIEAVRRR